MEWLREKVLKAVREMDEQKLWILFYFLFDEK